jgi:hypothetical protein
MFSVLESNLEDTFRIEKIHNNNNNSNPYLFAYQLNSLRASFKVTQVKEWKQTYTKYNTRRNNIQE